MFTVRSAAGFPAGPPPRPPFPTGLRGQLSSANLNHHLAVNIVRLVDCSAGLVMIVLLIGLWTVRWRERRWSSWWLIVSLTTAMWLQVYGNFIRLGTPLVLWQLPVSTAATVAGFIGLWWSVREAAETRTPAEVPVRSRV